jgi:hypothetical protein
MRRKIARKKGKKPRTVNRKRAAAQPMEEGIRKNIDFASMSEKDLVRYTMRLMEENGIKMKSQLQLQFRKLYGELKKKDLLNKIEFKAGRRWEGRSDEQLIELAKIMIMENGIKSRSELQKKDRNLYRVLRGRRLINKIGLERMIRDWSALDHCGLISFANTFIEKNGIRYRTELSILNGRLYDALRRRDLLNSINCDCKRKKWSKMNDEQIVEFAKKVMRERKIHDPKEFRKKEYGLYLTLQRRNLQNKVFGDKIKKRRNWASMSDEELISHSQQFIDERGIKNRKALTQIDSGLYQVIKTRNLSSELNFKGDVGSWKRYSDDELVSYSQRFIDEQGIMNVRNFQKKDGGLYATLRARNLVDRMKFVKNRRDWTRMDEGELIALAKRFVRENSIKKKYDLIKLDLGLYKVLWKRKLLAQVFSEIEQSKQQKLISGLTQAADAMEKFGDAG